MQRPSAASCTPPSDSAVKEEGLASADVREALPKPEQAEDSALPQGSGAVPCLSCKSCLFHEVPCGALFFSLPILLWPLVSPGALCLLSFSLCSLPCSSSKLPDTHPTAFPRYPMLLDAPGSLHVFHWFRCITFLFPWISQAPQLPPLSGPLESFSLIANQLFSLDCYCLVSLQMSVASPLICSYPSTTKTCHSLT